MTGIFITAQAGNTKGTDMRMNIMFGLDHVEQSDKNQEAMRLLAELSKKIYTESVELKAGDMFILRDLNGNRVGVADVFKE
jgi:hypothetical protein